MHCKSDDSLLLKQTFHTIEFDLMVLRHDRFAHWACPARCGTLQNTPRCRSFWLCPFCNSISINQFVLTEEKIPDIKERIDMAVFPALQAPIHFCWSSVRKDMESERHEETGKVWKGTKRHGEQKWCAWWSNKVMCIVLRVTWILGTWFDHFGGTYLGRQGGPHNHQIGALAVQLLEVDSPMFKEPSRSRVGCFAKSTECILSVWTRSKYHHVMYNSF